MTQVLIADDHALVIGGLKELLAPLDDIQVADVATDGRQVLDALHRSRFDLVLLDMHMPGPSGIDLIVRIRMHDPQLPILVLSMRNELQVARAAFKAGATGYVTKDNEPEELLAAIRKTAAGGRFIDPLLVDQMVFDTATARPDPAHEQLSTREFHVLSLLSCGKSINGIAHELGLSSKTVSSHKARLMRKLNFRSDADLVRYGLERGLVIETM
jgi:DNA-binding NarL/FixJ family response regulator